MRLRSLLAMALSFAVLVMASAVEAQSNRFDCNASRSARALCNDPLLAPSRAMDPISLSDRTVWAGTYACGPEELLADVVVIGPLKAATEAYFVTRKDPSSSANVFVGQTALKYALAYDDILEELKLSSPTIVFQDSSVQAARQLNLSAENQGKTLGGRVDPSCTAFVLERRDYPRLIAETLDASQKQPPGSVSVKLGDAHDPDLFCAVLSTWAKRVKASAPGRNYDRRLPNDPSTRIFIAN
jgi:hypothetical protein